jgi:predicted RNA binding protein YcfA (HicA-like mRNA interferase family)
MKTNVLLKHLKNHNCILLREGGNHSIWINMDNKLQTSVPRHPNINEITAKKICKQLNIPII